MTDWFPWVLSAVGILGFHLAGKKIWWAWYVNLANQALWLIFSIATQQWGFLAATLFYIVVFSNNARNWTRDHFGPKIHGVPYREAGKLMHEGLVKGLTEGSSVSNEDVSFPWEGLSTYLYAECGVKYPGYDVYCSERVGHDGETKTKRHHNHYVGVRWSTYNQMVDAPVDPYSKQRIDKEDLADLSDFDFDYNEVAYLRTDLTDAIAEAADLVRSSEYMTGSMNSVLKTLCQNVRVANCGALNPEWEGVRIGGGKNDTQSSMACTKPMGHSRSEDPTEKRHGYAGCFWE